MERPYEERDFTIGNVVGETLTLYRRFFLRFIALGLAVNLVVNLVGALATLPDSDTSAGLIAVAGVIASIVGYFWLQGAFIAQVEDVRDGRIDTTIGEIFARTREFLPYLAAAAIVVGAVIGGLGLLLVWVLGVLGALIVVVVALVLGTRWLVAAPAIVLERVGPIAALRRSNALVKGHSWRAFGILLVAGVLGGIIGGIGRAIFGALFSGFLEAWLAGSIGAALTAPFVGVASTLAYYHLRVSPAAATEQQPSLGAAYQDE